MVTNLPRARGNSCKATKETLARATRMVVSSCKHQLRNNQFKKMLQISKTTRLLSSIRCQTLHLWCLARAVSKPRKSLKANVQVRATGTKRLKTKFTFNILKRNKHQSTTMMCLENYFLSLDLLMKYIDSTKRSTSLIIIYASIN